MRVSIGFDPDPHSAPMDHGASRSWEYTAAEGAVTYSAVMALPEAEQGLTLGFCQIHGRSLPFEGAVRVYSGMMPKAISADSAAAQIHMPMKTRRSGLFMHVLQNVFCCGVISRLNRCK